MLLRNGSILAGTREALAEQLRLGQELRRKVERPDSGSDASTDASDASDASDGERAADGGSGGGNDGQVGGGRASSARVKAAALDLLQGVGRPWLGLRLGFGGAEMAELELMQGPTYPQGEFGCWSDK